MKYAGRHRFRAYRKDANHDEIKKAFISGGASVIDLASSGASIDLLIGWRTRWYPVECKDGKRPASQKKLTEKEIQLRLEAAKNDCAIEIIESADEVEEFLRVRR